MYTVAFLDEYGNPAYFSCYDVDTTRDGYLVCMKEYKSIVAIIPDQKVLYVVHDGTHIQH